MIGLCFSARNSRKYSSCLVSPRLAWTRAKFLDVESDEIAHVGFTVLAYPRKLATGAIVAGRDCAKEIIRVFLSRLFITFF